MSNRRVTLGPVTTSQMNSRSALVGAELMKQGTRRMSVGPTPRMSMGGIGMGSALMTMKEVAKEVVQTQPVGASRLSVGAIAVPAARRASVGVSRKSSVGMPHRGSTLESNKRVIDTRNIGDKAFMNASIRTLIFHLTKHGFDHAISPKILTRPAVKDFSNIVMFLFKQLDPNFQCTGKFEEEVVSVFKHLGYPIQISKANISAVGSPHAWPSLLASIMWLIELLAYDEAASAGAAEQLEMDLEDPSSYKAFYEYIALSYALYLQGEDDNYDALEQQFVESFENKNILAQQQIDGLTERNQGLTRETQDVEARRSYLPELEAKKADLERDQAKFEQLIEELQERRDALTRKASDREGELETLTQSLSSIKGEMISLEKRISSQELSPADVRSMVAERERLEEAQRQASETRQQVQRKVLEAEMSLRDGVQALEDSAKAYNSIAEDLKLVPHTAKNAHGKHYALEVNVQAKKGSRLVTTDVHNDIHPSLLDLRMKLEQTTADYRSDLMKEQDDAEEMELRRASLLETKAGAEGRTRRTDEAYKREKETLDQATDLHIKEMEAMESRLLRLRDTAAEEARSIAASRRAAEIRASRDARRVEHARLKRELIDSVMDAISQCASHRELVQTKLADLKGAFGVRLHQLLIGEEPSAPFSMAKNTSMNANAVDTSMQSATKSSEPVKLFDDEQDEDDGLLLQEDIDEEEVSPRLSTMGGRLSMRPLTLENIMLDLE